MLLDNYIKLLLIVTTKCFHFMGISPKHFSSLGEIPYKYKILNLQ